MPQPISIRTHKQVSVKAEQELKFRLFLVGITEQHEIVRGDSQIERVDFECFYKGNFNDMVKGKKKSKRGV